MNHLQHKLRGLLDIIVALIHEEVHLVGQLRHLRPLLLHHLPRLQRPRLGEVYRSVGPILDHLLQLGESVVLVALRLLQLRGGVLQIGLLPQNRHQAFDLADVGLFGDFQGEFLV